MKNKIFILLLTFGLLVSCNEEEFFDTAPTTALTNDGFWASTDDYRIYANGFYTMFSGHSTNWSASPIVFGDNNSDNLVPTEASTVAAGEHVIPASGAGYDFATLRKINILLDNAKKSHIAESELNPYIAEARFFRAVWYSGKVKRFGNYPWFESEVNMSSDNLYGPRTDRDIVTDNMLADINFAIENLPDNTNRDGHINKNIALAFKARMFLNEGTHSKYHGRVNATKYLQEAYDAAKQLIDGNKYGLYPNFRMLFASAKKNSINEVIYMRDYEHDLVTTATLRNLDDNGKLSSVSKSLVDSFLDIEGKPISQSTSYDESGGWATEFNNRDPRLAVTVSSPDSDLLEGAMPPVPGSTSTGTRSPTATGYFIEKHWRSDPAEYILAQKGALDAIIIRYGEILLIYAEAAQELGILTQATLDESINLLRDRVDMPPMVIANLMKDVDSDFPNLDVVTDEIRRERRVELAIEGFRYSDLIRWKQGPLLAKRFLGMKWIPSMYPEIDINTSPDIRLDSDGYIWPYALSHPAGRTFEDPKHYLFPLPADQLAIDTELTQNPFWVQ